MLELEEAIPTADPPAGAGKVLLVHIFLLALGDCCWCWRGPASAGKVLLVLAFLLALCDFCWCWKGSKCRPSFSRWKLLLLLARPLAR